VLKVAGVKAVSVMPNAPVGPAWRVVPQATNPFERAGAAPVNGETVAAEPLQDPPTGTVASSFTTTDVGTAGVNVLLIKSFRTERETKPFGVTGQEQQETNCSSSENAYTFAQMEPVRLAVVPDWFAAPRAPVFEILMTESPTFRFEA